MLLSPTPIAGAGLILLLEHPSNPLCRTRILPRRRKIRRSGRIPVEPPIPAGTPSERRHEINSLEKPTAAMGKSHPKPLRRNRQSCVPTKVDAPCRRQPDAKELAGEIMAGITDQLGRAVRKRGHQDTGGPGQAHLAAWVGPHTDHWRIQMARNHGLIGRDTGSTALKSALSCRSWVIARAFGVEGPENRRQGYATASMVCSPR